MKGLLGCLVGIAVWSSPLLSQAPGYTISTVAGGGPVYFADGIPATQATMIPSGIAVDAAGNLYISDGDEDDTCIFKVTPDGVIHVFAGYVPGDAYSPDGSSAIGAILNDPMGLAFDLAGNLYIADAYDYSVRKVDGNGVITTVAGGGAPPMANVSLSFPTGVAVDAAGNLYIADSLANVVRMVDPAGNVTIVAGSVAFTPDLGDGGPATSAALNSPSGVAMDSAGNLYIADTSNARIRKVSNGFITTVAGSGARSYSGDGGPATQAGLYVPHGVAVDNAGNIYIADTGNNAVRMVTPDGTISTIAGNGQEGFSGDGGPAAAASLDFPGSVAVGADGSSIYVADSRNGCVRLLTPATQ